MVKTSLLGLLVLGVACPAAAQTPPTDPWPTLLITAPRSPTAAATAPLSLTRLTRSDLQQGRPEINLSESLLQVPGLLAQSRQNDAQDLQLISRGFGARSPFGIRGLRIYVDGIPATMPDGQSQVAHLDLGTTGQIDVLRGPFSALYGQSSGGVIAVTTAAATETALTATLGRGSFGAERYAVVASRNAARHNLVASVAHAATDGFRQHSASHRDTANFKGAWIAADRLTVTLSGNAFRLRAADPLGLTPAQWSADPIQAGTGALTFDTRKSVQQVQLGTQVRWRWRESRELQGMLYGGRRQTEQFQAIPVSSQRAPTHAGGVIDLNRHYYGGDLRLVVSGTQWGGATQWTVGLSADRLAERRRGYENFLSTELGVRGALRRDDANLVTNLDQYGQAQWASERWTVLLGARHSQVQFISDDHYLAVGNGDDSGALTFAATSPVFGLSYQLHPRWRGYVAVGRGFETPTLTELAYRSTDGTQTGLNLALLPARSRQVELGVKAASAEQWQLAVALFRGDTRDELAVLSNSGGRAVYQNVPQTRREGIEVAWSGHWQRPFSATLAHTVLRAKYRQGFNTCVGLPCAVQSVAAGNSLPGVPTAITYAQGAWQSASGALRVALEWQRISGVAADDLNRVRTDGTQLAHLQLAVTQPMGDYRVQSSLRVDNLLNRRSIGSVIVNEANQRYGEPAPGRTWWLGFKVTHRLAP